MVNTTTYKKTVIVVFIIIFAACIIACALGWNLFNSINNNMKTAETQADIDSRRWFRTYFIVILALSLIAFGLAIYAAYINFEVDTKARAVADKVKELRAAIAASSDASLRELLTVSA